jgi:hypothetical protein
LWYDAGQTNGIRKVPALPGAAFSVSQIAATFPLAGQTGLYFKCII